MFVRQRFSVTAAYASSRSTRKLTTLRRRHTSHCGAVEIVVLRQLQSEDSLVAERANIHEGFDLVCILFCQFVGKQLVVWKALLALLQVAFAEFWAELGAAHLFVLLATGLAAANESLCCSFDH